VFRHKVGCSLHAYRHQLRVRSAADQVLGGADDLTHVVLDVGFSSHSHLTAAFRAAFGVPPSRAGTPVGGAGPDPRRRAGGKLPARNYVELL
jgi:AraC-like DNA-binding protein